MALRVVDLPDFGGAGNTSAGIIPQNSGFYVVRNNREIMEAHTFGFYKKHPDYSHFGAELSFDGSLDAHFHTDVKKMSIHPSQSFLGKLRQATQALIRESGREGRARANTEKGQIDHSTAEANITRWASLIPKPKALIEKRTPRGRKGTHPHRDGDKPRTPHITNLRTISGLKVAFDEGDYGEQSPFYLVKQEGRTITVTYNREQLEPNAQIIDVESQSPPVEFGYDQDLFMELDEFLVQYKSSLDYLAKIPSPLLGRNRWNPRSFGDKGQRLVKMLNSALPKDQQHTVPAFEDVVLSKHKENLEMLINARDKLNHYVEGGLDYRNFSVFGMKERGVIRLRVPMWSDDQRIVDFMRVSFGNLIGLCEGFIAFFLQYSTKPGLVIFHNPVDPESANSPLRVITQEEMHAQLRSIGRPPDREYLRTK